MEISLPWNPIKALAVLVNDTDIRPWTRGVWLNFEGPHVVVWSTDGAHLGAFRTEEPSILTNSLMVPLHIIKAASKAFGVGATIKRDEDGRCSIESFGTRHYWQDEKLVPPDWRRVLPADRPTGVAQQFNPALLADFIKLRELLLTPAAKKDERKKPAVAPVRVSHNGGPTTAKYAPGLVELMGVPDFIGAVMPISLDKEGGVYTGAVPDWVRETGTPTPPAAQAEVSETADDLV